MPKFEWQNLYKIAYVDSEGYYNQEIRFAASDLDNALKTFRKVHPHRQAYSLTSITETHEAICVYKD